jgi:hypothetical protein
LGLIVLLAATIWPAIYDSGPFYFPDTLTYIGTADAAVHHFTGWETAWTMKKLETSSVFTAPQRDEAHARSMRGPRDSSPVPKKEAGFLGRSVYYGLLLYFGAADHFFGLTIVLQGIAVLASIWLVLRLQGMIVWPAIFLLGLLLCFFSDAAFFACFLMPDLFAGIAILVCAALFTAEREVRADEAAIAWSLLSASLLFHDSVPAVVVALSVSYFAWKILRRSQLNLWQDRVKYGVLFAALITSAVGRSAYVTLIKHSVGDAPLRIPFLSAHLIEGPGTTFLHATCPGNGFVLCEFIDRFPESSGTFLWGVGGGSSVSWKYMSPALERRVNLEDLGFAGAVFRNAPLEFLEFMGKDILRQIKNFSLAEFLYPPNLKREFDEKLPPRNRAEVDRSRAYVGDLPIRAFSTLNYAFVAAALVFLAQRRLFRGGGSPGDEGKWKLTAWVITGAVINATVCGAVSGPFSRYQARVVWLLPLAALLFVVDGLVKRTETVVADRQLG